MRIRPIHGDAYLLFWNSSLSERVYDVILASIGHNYIEVVSYKYISFFFFISILTCRVRIMIKCFVVKPSEVEPLLISKVTWSSDIIQDCY